MLKVLRFAAVLGLVIWLGAMITMTFYVAPTLFGMKADPVPNSSVAADIIGPLLHEMEVTGWIGIPIIIALVLGIWTKTRRRALVTASVMLAVAWAGGLFNGTKLTNDLHQIRVELQDELGGYHLAPPEHPKRARFSMLHAISSSIAMINLLLGLGALYCVTQLSGDETAALAGEGSGALVASSSEQTSAASG